MLACNVGERKGSRERVRVSEGLRREKETTLCTSGHRGAHDERTTDASTVRSAMPVCLSGARDVGRQFDPHDPQPNRGIIYKLFSAYFFKSVMINIHARHEETSG